MMMSDFRPEVKIRQFRTCALKNDSVGHNGLSYGADTVHVPQNVFLVYYYDFSFWANTSLTNFTYFEFS